VQVDKQRYLVAPYGESEWVRNLRAAGEGELDGPHGREHFVAREVPTDQRVPIIEIYRQQTGRTVERLFRAMPDPDSHPVFALERTTSHSA
jgi:hypothetical protein